MNKLITALRQQYKLIAVGFGGMAIGMTVLAFAPVRAAIPDTGGSIHGCRNTTTTILRVIDNASQSCDSNETSLNWDQRGVRGYAHILSTGSNSYSIDTNRSYKVSNLHVTNVSFNRNQLCMTVSNTPKNISATRSDQDAGSGELGLAIKDENGWSRSAGSACDSVDSTTNVYVSAPNAPFFLTIF